VAVPAALASLMPDFRFDSGHQAGCRRRSGKTIAGSPAALKGGPQVMSKLVRRSWPAFLFSMAGAISPAQAFDSFTVRLLNHPNGSASADANAVDDRDYGLRLDNGKVQTFAFEDVRMEFFLPPAPHTSSTVFATISGTIAHLQSSNGVGLGYSANSGLDPLDQRWSIMGTFRLIDGHGPLFPDASIPGMDMLQRLIDAGISSNAIGFNDYEVKITPLFNEALTPAVYKGPRCFVEKFASGIPSALMLQFRHRLNPAIFTGPEWDVVTGNGWLMAKDGSGTTYTRDFLFYTPDVPEPGTIGLLATGAAACCRRRKY